jgi:hypothetical protein
MGKSSLWGVLDRILRGYRRVCAIIAQLRKQAVLFCAAQN